MQQQKSQLSNAGNLKLFSKEEVFDQQVQKIIDDVNSYKILSYLRFLVIKLGLKQIMHKRIVQQIFQKYIANQQLVIDYRYSSSQEHFNCLKEGLQLLPNLQYFKLSLVSILFGKGEKNQQVMKEVLQSLSNLKGFELIISECQLEDNYIQNLGQSLQKLQSLQNLNLCLSANMLGKIQPVLQRLGNYLLKLLPRLEQLKVNLYDNYLGESSLGALIVEKKVLQNLKCCELNFRSNYLGKNQFELQYLGLFLLRVPGLKQLNLNLRNNKLGLDYKNLLYLGEGIQKLQCLEDLQLDLSENDFGQSEENWKQFGQSFFQKKSRLKKLVLKLQDNNTQENDAYMKYLGKGLSLLSGCLEELYLDLSEYTLGDIEKDLGFLEQGMKKLGKLNKLELSLINDDLEEYQVQKFRENIGLFLPQLQQFDIDY